MICLPTRGHECDGQGQAFGLPLNSAAAVASDRIDAPTNTPCCQLNDSKTSGTPAGRRPPKMIASIGTPCGLFHSGSRMEHCSIDVQKLQVRRKNASHTLLNLRRVCRECLPAVGMRGWFAQVHRPSLVLPRSDQRLVKSIDLLADSFPVHIAIAGFRHVRENCILVHHIYRQRRSSHVLSDPPART